DDSTSARQGDGFCEELADDIPASGAESLAHSDFTRAFRDRHEHDVHHANSTDKEPDGTDYDHRNGNRSRDLTELTRKLLGTGNREIIRLSGRNMSPPPQQADDFVLRLGLSTRRRLCANEVFVV